MGCLKILVTSLCPLFDTLAGLKICHFLFGNWFIDALPFILNVFFYFFQKKKFTISYLSFTLLSLLFFLNSKYFWIFIEEKWFTVSQSSGPSYKQTLDTT